MLEIVSSSFPFLFPFVSLYFSIHSWSEKNIYDRNQNNDNFNIFKDS